ncbi:MAG: hypothetical protein QXW45_06790 [Thermosphaera sp.]
MSQQTYPIGLTGNIYPPTIAGVTDLGSSSASVSGTTYTDTHTYQSNTGVSRGGTFVSKTITLSKPSILVIFGELHFNGASGQVGGVYEIQVRLDGKKIKTIVSSTDSPPVFHGKYYAYVVGVGIGNHTVDLYLSGTALGSGVLFYADLYILAIS